MLHILWWSQFICQSDRKAIAAPIRKRIRLRRGSFLSRPPAGMVDLEQGRAVASGLSANPWMIGEPDRESTDGETTDRIEAGIGTGCRLDARPPIRCRRVRRPAAGSPAIRFSRQSALHYRRKPFRHRTRRRSQPAARMLHSRMLHVAAAAGHAFRGCIAPCATAVFADCVDLALRVSRPQERAQSGQRPGPAAGRLKHLRASRPCLLPFAFSQLGAARTIAHPTASTILPEQRR